jgi:O-antigen ligase
MRTDFAAEIPLTIALLAWLLFQPWAFGTMHPWSQWTAACLALLAFAFALRSHARRRRFTPTTTPPLRQLLNTLPVWCLVALLLYVTAQGLNPAWRHMQSSSHWWLERLDAVSWLPQGVEAPFAKMNTRRKLLIWASPALACLAVWIGLRHRRSVHWLLTALVVNAWAVAMLGVAQKADGTDRIYWRFPFVADVFGSFVYRNHAAAYFVIAAALAIGLARWHRREGLTRMARSTPAPVLLLVALFLVFAVTVSGSRLGAGLILATTVAILLAGGSRPGLPRRLGIVAAIALAAALAASTLGGGTARRFQEFRNLTANDSARGRVYGMELTRRMIDAHPWTGVGAGAFRYLEPVYHREFPLLTQRTNFWSAHASYTIRYVLQDAHNDHLQVLAELGVLGALPVYALVAAALAGLTVRRAHPVARASLIATAALLLYACADFPFLNPAVLNALAVAIVAAIRWADLEAGAIGAETPPAR